MSKQKIEKRRGTKDTTSVLTVRIDKDLDNLLEKARRERRISKATLIRNYLEMVKYIVIDQNSVRSIDDRDFIIIKRKIFKKFLKSFEIEEQMDYGIRFAQFINDLARLHSRIDDIEYKIEICQHLGFFPKFQDDDNFILFSNKFGPKKFVEAFVYKLFNHEPDMEYDITFTDENIENSKKKEQEYTKKIGPTYRAESYYAFEFAKIEKEEE